VSHGSHHHTSTESSAQVAVARKARVLKVKAEERRAEPACQARLAANAAHIADVALAADVPRNRHEQHEHGGRAPPIRLLGKHDVLAITNVTFPTIWAWMRGGKFPRSRIVGGKSMWLSTEVDAWLAALPVRPLKGDAAEVEVA
jgi:predicted DNA-binding transcriptional regulator AlpA